MSPIRNRFSSAGHTEAALLGSHATPRSQAVALSYEAHAVAPRILAKGEGVIAESILQRAKELGIPLKAEPELIPLLMQLDLDSFIPPALYAAVAEILVWAYQIDASSQPLHVVNIDQDNINDTDISSGI